MIIEKLNKVLNEAFKSAGYEGEVGVIESNRPELCDYQCDSCFKLSKIFKCAPIMIAQKVASEINNLKNINDYFKSVGAVNPGFINLVLSEKFLNDQINEINGLKNFGIVEDEPKTVFLDYGGPNVAKPLHVGHLRSAIVGESIKRIVEFAGNKTISDVHLGDYGLQIGEVIYGLKEKNIKPNEITLELLEEIYPNMSGRCKDDEGLKECCANITKELQEGNEKYQEYWKEICKISIADIKRLYDYLGVRFDMWEGESGAYRYLPMLFEKYQKENKLVLSEGAYTIPITQSDDPKELPPLIFRKSNGAYLYGSTDIATVYERMNKFNPDQFIYVADLRQSLHFEQFFRSCDILGIAKRSSFMYCGFGTVNGKDGKPYKTRAGDSPKLDSLFNQVKEILIKDRPDANASQEDLNILVNAVIKFADLQNGRERDYVFDIDKFSKISGKTGPYILYTYLRLNKILLSEDEFEFNVNGESVNESERNLKLAILTLNKSFAKAYDELMPSFICDYVFNLCNIANTFYEQNRIKNQEDKFVKTSWLSLIKITTKVLKDMLKLLIIDIPSVM